MNGLFLSDLHLFSKRSVGQQRWEESRALISDSSLVVLGGDMFDLRWSQLGSLTATIDAAEQWLTDAFELNPGARWVYLPGNHDCHPAMLTLLTKLAKRGTGFEWHPFFWHWHGHVFLHGDALDAAIHRDGLEGYRQRFHEDRPKGPLGNLLYSAVIFSRLHGVVPRIRHTRTRTCETLLRYLDRESGIDRQTIQSVYFGHTHVPFSDYRHNDIAFHNPGSGIRHLPFHPITFQAPDV